MSHPRKPAPRIDSPLAKRLFIPLIIAIPSFLIGLRTAHTFTSHPSPAPSPLPEPPLPHFTATQPIPLGLRWLRQGYENAWQFSTLHSTVDDLNVSVVNTLERHGGTLPRLVVSFTSLPNRFLLQAPALIRMLKGQTYPPDLIYVCIPVSSRRSNDSFRIPEWMHRDPMLRVLRPAVDMGPATKLIPALEAEIALGNLDTRVVTVDDDDEGRWTEDVLLQLFAYSIYFPDAAVGFSGWNVTCMVSDAHCSPQDSGVVQRENPTRLHNYIKQADEFYCHSFSDMRKNLYANCLGAVRKNFAAFVDVLEGYRGVVYQPRFFDMNRLKSLAHGSVPDFFFLCDDVWFSGWLAVQNVSRMVVNPAIHHDASVKVTLLKYSGGRGLSISMPNDSELAEERGDGALMESDLKDLDVLYFASNHMGVRWFGMNSGWTADMWTRPPGFQYPSEIGT